VVTPLAGPVEFTVKYVGPMPMPEADAKELREFQRQVIRLQRNLTATTAAANDLTTRLDQIRQALDVTPAAPAGARERARKAIAAHRETLRALLGDRVLAARNENVPESVTDRVGVAAGAARTVIAKPTGTQREQYRIARTELDAVTEELRKRLAGDVKELEQILDKLDAPYTPGRLPGRKDQ
jgi:hypothetical protein